MKKRFCDRIPADIKIRFNLWNPLVWKEEYSGTIENLSEKGMLISAKTRDFPSDSLLEIFIPINKEDLFIPVIYSNIVWKRVLPDKSCDRIGIEFSISHKNYLEFIKDIKAASKS